MEDIPELGLPRFELPLDVDEADLLEVLLTEDGEGVIPQEPFEDIEPSNELSDVVKLNTTSSMPTVKEEVAQHKKMSSSSYNIKNEDENDEALSNDPNELKKQRRLIRNRMSAQLHRERKKAYIDKLEAEVKQRDNTITLLGVRINELENENAKLRRMLSNGESSPSIDAFDLGFTTHEESCDSDASSEGSSMPLRKRQASQENEKSFVKSARINPGTILASLAFLFLFRASIFDKGINKAANSLVPVDTSTYPVRQGRVLFGVDENFLEENTDSSLALVSPPPVQLNTKSVPVKSASHTSPTTNKSYFFCPTKFHSPSGTWLHPSNKTDVGDVSQRHKSGDKRRLRARETITPPSPINTPKKMDLRDSSEETTDSMMVISKSQRISREEPTNINEEDSYPHLTLVVPSSSIDGVSSLGAQSNWLEIDCRMHSAKFVDFK